MTELLTTFKYMSIPIGAPVTVTWMNTQKENGVVCGYENYHGWSTELQPYVKVKMTISGIPSTFPAEKVRIRYDLPAPFTLWQLNVLAQEDVNDTWGGKPQLAPKHIASYWEWSKLNVIKIKPAKVLIRYTNPCPFTLWQLNSLVNCKAEMPWAGRASIVLLAPENIQAAWDTHRLSYYDSFFLS